MNISDLVIRADELLALGDQALATRYSTSGEFNINYVKESNMAGFKSAVLSFIDRVFGSNHPHFKEFDKQTQNHFLSDAERGIAILHAIRAEISGGWLFNVKSLVAAELFSDFLEMAEHLLETGYKDPAAVMIGSVLEEHLRQLCLKNSIETEEEKDGKFVPRKADRLNADLVKAKVYSKLDQKQITAWLDLRNNAAHGKYAEYTHEQVAQFLSGVLGFMARVAP